MCFAVSMYSIAPDVLMYCNIFTYSKLKGRSEQGMYEKKIDFGERKERRKKLHVCTC